jgi:hypothetical protein
MTEVSLATWNLHQGFDRRPANIAATWDYVADVIRPTVALVQEAAVIPETSGGSVASRDDAVRFGTAVVGYQARLEPLPAVKSRFSSRWTFEISPRVPASFAAAHVVDLPDAVEAFVAVSLYGVMGPVYATSGVLRAIADLTPLFDSRTFGRRIVLGGDLNVYDQSRDKVERGRWDAILPLIESLGLVNLHKLTQPERGAHPMCICRRPDCWHVETFRHRLRGTDEPGYYMTDYLFATPEMADRLIALEVWSDRAQAWVLSDHCPLVARFDL